jgi:hypothetical protein
MPRQPVTNGRLAGLDSLRDFGDRHAAIDQSLELAPFQPAACRVLPVVGRAQPVFLHPIGDRRFVTPEAAADLHKRKAPAEQLPKRGAIHTPIFLTAWDETLERMFACARHT